MLADARASMAMMVEQADPGLSLAKSVPKNKYQVMTDWEAYAHSFASLGAQPAPVGASGAAVRYAGLNHASDRSAGSRPPVPPASHAPSDFGAAGGRLRSVDLAAASQDTPATPPAPIAPALLPNSADAFANAAYGSLAKGERRDAVRLFDAALAEPFDPRSPDWRRTRDTLRRRWSGEAYTLLRNPGPVGPTASPVLGGGQSGANLAWTIDPLARHPLGIVARANVASDANGAPVWPLAQGAIGLRWTVRPGLSISAERLVALGILGQNQWTVRVAGGANVHSHGLAWSGYAEAGVLGRGDSYAGGQLRSMRAMLGGRLEAGASVWGSVQAGHGVVLGRVDVGPSLGSQLKLGPTTLRIAGDWRFRVAGGAEPGSGPAVTVSAAF